MLMKQVKGKVVVGIVVFGSWLRSQPIYIQILRRQCCLREVEANEVIRRGGCRGHCCGQGGIS